MDGDIMLWATTNDEVEADLGKQPATTRTNGG